MAGMNGILLDELSGEILQAMMNWRKNNDRNFDGVVIVSVADARRWDRTQHVGSKGLIWGVPCRVENLTPGHFMLFDVMP